MNVPKNTGDDVRGLGEPLESFTKFFVKIEKKNMINVIEYGLWREVFGLQDPPN